MPRRVESSPSISAAPSIGCWRRIPTFPRIPENCICVSTSLVLSAMPQFPVCHKERVGAEADRPRSPAPSITFLTAMIWEFRDDADFYEPVANSGEITAMLMSHLQNAYDRTVREEGSQSLLARKLKQRKEFLRTLFHRQSDAPPPYWTW